MGRESVAVQAIRSGWATLTVRYVAALTILAVLAIAGEVFRERVLAEQRSNTRIINIAGRQRMLSQRLVKEVVLAATATDSASRAELLAARDSTLAAWARGRRILLDGDTAEDYVALPEGPLRDRLLSVAPIVQAMRAAADRLDVAAIRQYDGQYLNEMDSITFGLTATFDAQSAALVRADRARVVVVVLVIILLGLFVLRPAARSIERNAYDMRRKNTDLDAALAEAHSVARIKDEFLATTSHELRTPLNAVIGLSGLLRSTPLDARQRQFVDTINASGENLLQLINDILDLSKMDAGKLELEQMDFELREVTESAVETLALRAESKGVELGVLFAPGTPDMVRGDAGRFGQILLNLLGNALKFTETGSVIVRVRAAEHPTDARHVRIEVEDTGIGISEEAQARLFQPFSQADASTTRKYGGTGLGLSISRRLAELMGGRVGLQSQLGVGSTFWFEIPFAVPEDVHDIEPADGETFAGQRVLIVDDLAANRLVLGTLLRAWGMEVLEADGPLQAISALAGAVRDGQPIPLAVLDWQMPDMDGDALARQIRADPSFAGIKLILLSSFSRGPSSDAANGGSFDYTLAKPVRQRALWRALTAVLRSDTATDDPAAPAALPQFTGARVLVVDDNPVNVLVARAMLEQLGVVADVAGNGREAIDAVDRVGGMYDLILMDVQMPELDGPSATRELRAKYKHAAKYIPIVAVTAAAMSEDRTACQAAGMNDYITKPIAFDVLLSTISRWVPR